MVEREKRWTRLFVGYSISMYLKEANLKELECFDAASLNKKWNGDNWHRCETDVN